MSRRNTTTEEQAALRGRTSYYLGHVNSVPFHSSRKPGMKMPTVRDCLSDFSSSSKVEASKDPGEKLLPQNIILWLMIRTPVTFQVASLASVTPGELLWWGDLSRGRGYIASVLM